MLIPFLIDLISPPPAPPLVQAFDAARSQPLAPPSVPQSAPILIASASENASVQLPQLSAAAPVAYPSFNNPVLEQQLSRYLQYVAVMGTPDILIVGSSRSRQGIHPVTLERTLAARGYGRVRVFNFSVNGATAQVVNFVLSRLLSSEQLPRLILWGDGLRAFNSGRTDATFQKILASPGYQYLASGKRPILANPPQPRSQPQTVCIESPLAALALNRTAGDGQSSLLVPITGYQSFDQALSAASVTSRLRWYPNRQQQPCKTVRVRTLPQSRSRSSQPLPFALPQVPVSTGFLEVSQRFDPKTYYQRYPRVSGQYDGDYTPFIVEGGKQFAALKSVAALARNKGIPLLVVNMPLSQPHLDGMRLAYEQQFNQKMRRLANQEKFYFRNFLQAWPQRNDYFADPSHVNLYGAQVLAIQIAQDPTLPWPRQGASSRAR